MQRQRVRRTSADSSSVAICLKFGSTVRVTCKFVDHGCLGSRCEPITRTICVLCVSVGREGGWWVKVSSLEDLAAEPFLDRGIRKLATDRGYALPFDMLGWSTLWGATLLQQTRYADVDRRCCVAHSLRLALVPCLSLTILTISVHLGIPNLGGRWPDA